MQVTPTMHFDGQCLEAIELYARALGLQMDFVLKYSDANPQDYINADPARKDLVYHSEGRIGGQRIMFSDELDRRHAYEPGIFLTITFDTAEEVRAAYHALLQGGEVIHPLTATTYSSQMGSLIDRFGFRWGLMTEQTDR